MFAPTAALSQTRATPADALASLPARAREAAVPCAWWSVRGVEELSEALTVRGGVVEPARCQDDCGAMVTVLDSGALGYAATADVSPAGLRRAFERAQALARAVAPFNLVPLQPADLPNPKGHWQGPQQLPAHDYRRRDMLDRLRLWDAALAAAGDKIVDRRAAVTATAVSTVLVTSHGGEAVTHYHVLHPVLEAFASDGRTTQRRTHMDTARQAGLELLDELAFDGHARRVGEEAVQLVAAPNCPTGTMTLLLAPDQMMLQIHESIGHPLELDRILGDERNFAGTSFVVPDMFGSYQYGSELLNITFDPTVPGELASLAVDDYGTATQRALLIDRGVLMRPLGGQLSQARAILPGVATTRACSWNRPPIDRMSNLNLEAGSSTDAELIAGTARGVLMHTNLSWSIDDSRNKFQFGCEVGELIEDGRIVGWVRNPCYRGISATFWRSLTGVGQGRGVHGTPFCGKGEPTQVIRVGHASPMCRFGDVAVFGAQD